MIERQKICFVVMGFGKKTDYESGRTLNLDATYEAIIKPSVEANEYRCIRANEILQSGIIDLKMYEMLLRADLVIADISTGNVNAVYELGVRHALRPFSTIVMREKEGKLHFDLDHTAIFMYEHLGKDIGNAEAHRARRCLGELIKQVSNNPKPDSPVYTYIPFLKQPAFTNEEFKELLTDAEESQERFSLLLNKAETAADDSEHTIAMSKFKSLLELQPDNSYLRQQAALHTYKSEEPSKLLALIEAQNILKPLDPENSNDPETLGLSGSIHKRLWTYTKDRVTLDLAIHFYRKGFELKEDYYNGENAAFCFEIRSNLQDIEEEALFDQMSALKIRNIILKNLLCTIKDKNFSDRYDQHWIYATLANCYFALGNKEESKKYETLFFKKKPAKWQYETYLENKRRIIEIHKPCKRKE